MKSILLVEDCEIFQYLVEVTMEQVNSEITLYKAFDGEEALELLFEQGITPDIILLDINMPRMNGHEFLIEYSQKRKGNIPIVAMLTSSDQEDDKQQVKQFNFVKDYIVKPLTRENISVLQELVSQADNDQ